MMQLSKFLSHSGVCSRRDAKDLIKSGRVTINGNRQENPITKVLINDIVKLDGHQLYLHERSRLWLYNKPRGEITSHKDPQGRKTVFANLPKELAHLVSVGRLDINSEGLLLLTNNGDVARFFELPENKFIRLYNVRVYGKIDMIAFNQLKQGCIINGIGYAGIIVKVLETKNMNHWLEISLTEGKNREIRKVMNHLGLQVNRLIRIGYGPYRLLDLAKGNIQEVSLEDVYYCRKVSRT
jgi:23S rRNA pseudouridine2605 synthase